MAFRGFTEEDLSQIKGAGLESNSESDYDAEEEEEEEQTDHMYNGVFIGASASFSGRGKPKMVNCVRAKSLPFTQIPKEAMLSMPNNTADNKLPTVESPQTFEPPSISKDSSDSADHSSSETSLASPFKNQDEPNCPTLEDCSSSDVDFKQVKLVLHPHLPNPSTIGVRLDLATVKSLPLDWDNTASLDALIEFEKNRKKLEDLNDKKKKELKKALEEKAKKTEEDMKKISEISQELKKLDSTLSNDVSILRKQIEIASWDFNDAQKRFDKAEKEYLEAKLELFTKREKKELLTGHLCSIIEQNEFRKAKKLSDLMGQLEIGSKEMAHRKANSSEPDAVDANSTIHNDVPLPP